MLGTGPRATISAPCSPCCHTKNVEFLVSCLPQVSESQFLLPAAPTVAPGIFNSQSDVWLLLTKFSCGVTPRLIQARAGAAPPCDPSWGVPAMQQGLSHATKYFGDGFFLR